MISFMSSGHFRRRLLQGEGFQHYEAWTLQEECFRGEGNQPSKNCTLQEECFMRTGHLGKRPRGMRICFMRSEGKIGGGWSNSRGGEYSRNYSEKAEGGNEEGKTEVDARLSCPSTTQGEGRYGRVL